MATARSTVITTFEISEEVAHDAAARSFRELAGREAVSIRVVKRRTSGIVEVNGDPFDLLAADLVAWDFEAAF